MKFKILAAIAILLPSLVYGWQYSTLPGGPTSGDEIRVQRGSVFYEYDPSNFALTSDLSGYQLDLDVVPLAEAQAGTATTERVWTAQRVAQAIAALGTGVDEIVYQADCSLITNGFCIDTDDGKLYFYDGVNPVEIDYAKIAGVESGATADQTGAEIDTLLDTLLGHTNWTLDWTSDLGGTTIHANNIPDLSGTYLTSEVDGSTTNEIQNASQVDMSVTDSADVDDDANTSETLTVEQAVLGLDTRVDTLESESQTINIDTLAGLGLTFHFRADSNVCDTGAAGHSAALATLAGMGITTSYIVCDEFTANMDLTGIALTQNVGTISVTTSGFNVSLTGIGGTQAVGTVDVQGGEDVILTGLGMTHAVGTVNVGVVGLSEVTLTGIAATEAVGTISVTEPLNEVTLTGIAATKAVGTITVAAGNPDYTTSFVSGVDGWSYYDGGGAYGPSACGISAGARVTNEGRTDSYSYYLSGSTGTPGCTEDFYNGCIYQQFTNVDAGTITVYAKGEDDTYGTPTVRILEGCTTTCTGGTQRELQNLNISGYTAAQGTLAGGSNVRICIHTNFGVSSIWVDDILVPGAGP